MSRGALYYLMAPLLILASLLQSTAATRLEVNGVKPDLVLLLVLVGALVYGSRAGVVWAFIGGIALDIFSGGPMGASSLALMAAALVAGLGHRPFSRFNLLVPISASIVGTIIYALSYLAILAGLDYLDIFHHALPVAPTFQYVVAPALLYNTTLMLAAMPFLNRIPETQNI